MREILFKAKRKKNGEWVEGQYVYLLNPHTENGEPVKHLICNGTNVFNYEVDPDTLCQYTGLKDKNSNKIWENDICIVRNKSIDEEDGYFKVEYDEDAAQYVLDGFGLTVPFGNVFATDCEVAGNIFDNPELVL